MDAPRAAPVLPPSAEGRLTRLAAMRVKDRFALDGLLCKAKLLATAALGDPLLGFHLAASFELRELGLLYYVQSSSASLGEALARMARYSSVAHEGLGATFTSRGGASMRLQYVGVPRHADRHQMEALTTALVRICRELTGTHVLPVRIALSHPRCRACAEFEEFVGAPIEFGSDRDEITYPAIAGDLPVISADPYLNESLVRYWEDALERHDGPQRPLRAAVENAILPLLPHGKVRVSTVAKALRLSTRTLTRRPAAEGLTFAQVLEEMRVSLGVRYLKDPDLTVSQVAWLLGFQEVSAFTHAFKRWTGSTPSERRKREGAQAPVI